MNQSVNEPMEETGEPLLLPVPAAYERATGGGRNAAYAAAHRGDMPTVRIGGRIFCQWRRWKRELEGNVTPNPAA